MITDAMIVNNDNCALAPSCDRILRAARAIVAHWDEFGPEHGFDESMEALRSATGERVQSSAAAAT